MNVRTLVLSVIGVLLVANIACALTGDDSAADTKFSVSDDRASPNTLNFNEPFKYVVSLGLAFTSTVVELEQESKMS